MGLRIPRTLITSDPEAAREFVAEQGLGRTFFNTLLDENSASHIALGDAYASPIADPADLPRINVSDIHVDFMIGSDEVTVSGVTRGGDELSLLAGGSWQV